MSEFQEGDKVQIIDGGLEGQYYDLDPSFIGQVGTIVNIVTYPYSGMVTDVLVDLDGGVTAFELPNIRKYVEPITEQLELPFDLIDEAKPATPRVTYLYVVEDEDGVYGKTFDRDHAREIKASYGGKKAGVIITAYAAVKEIR